MESIRNFILVGLSNVRNLYEYSDGDPVNAIDPEGAEAKPLNNGSESDCQQCNDDCWEQRTKCIWDCKTKGPPVCADDLDLTCNLICTQFYTYCVETKCEQGLGCP